MLRANKVFQYQVYWAGKRMEVTVSEVKSFLTGQFRASARHELTTPKPMGKEKNTCTFILFVLFL